MKADSRFSKQDSVFWAYVRAITEVLGSSRRGAGQVEAFTVKRMIEGLEKLGRPTEPLETTDLGQRLQNYFAYRADLLNNQVRQDLMVASQAKELYEQVVYRVAEAAPVPVADRKGAIVAYNVVVAGHDVRVPMNKQKGEKRAPAFLTGIVNLLIAYHLEGRACDYDPKSIPVIDHDESLYAALSRRMDGSYPSTVNPVAMWELKEYYYTTTFGSKISDAVYITALDGYERRDVEDVTHTPIEHLVMVDAYDTWWGKGKSYLCRFIDLLNMGLVSEVLFGREVTRRIPEIVPKWVKISARETEPEV